MVFHNLFRDESCFFKSTFVLRCGVESGILKQELLLTTHGGTPLSRSARILLTDGRKRTRKKDQNVSVELSRSFLCFFAAHR